MLLQARPVIRVCDLYRYTGLRRSQIEELIKRKILKPFQPPGGRIRVVFEEDVARLQQSMVEQAAAKAATSIKEIPPNANRKRARKTADEGAAA